MHGNRQYDGNTRISSQFCILLPGFSCGSMHMQNLMKVAKELEEAISKAVSAVEGTMPCRPVAGVEIYAHLVALYCKYHQLPLSPFSARTSMIPEASHATCKRGTPHRFFALRLIIADPSSMTTAFDVHTEGPGGEIRHRLAVSVNGRLDMRATAEEYTSCCSSTLHHSTHTAFPLHRSHPSDYRHGRVAQESPLHRRSLVMFWACV